MKRRIITSLKFLLAGVLFMSALPAAQALITATVTSPQTQYTAGVDNTFDFQITTTSGGAEWVDKYQFDFPAGITFVSGTASGGGNCNTNAGVRAVCAPSVSWKTNAAIPCAGNFARTGCGVYFAPGVNNFTITVSVPAGFSGPLTVNLACYGDGFGATPHEDLVNQITYAQLLPPNPCVFTCPDDININLDPGACDAVINYNLPTFEGDCDVLIATPFTLTQNVVVGNINNAWDCGCVPTSHWRVYTNGPSQLTLTQLRMGNWNPGTINVFVHSYTGPVGGLLNQTLMTPLGSSGNFVLPGGQGIATVPLPNIVIAPGQTFVVEQRKVAGIFLTAVNSSGQTAPSYLSCCSTNAPPLACNGAICPQTYAMLGFGGSHLIQELGGTSLQLQPPVIVQTSGLPSGSTFPIGTTTNCFDLVNPTDNTVINSCCFDVNIIEFPNPISSLVCNDLVYISLDEDCNYCLGADGVLEGGPYHCYDDYIVEVDKTAPFGNGPWLPACFGPSDVGKTYQVRVTDSDPPFNKCWGNVKIEDKLAPVLVCEDALLPCNFPDFSPESVQTASLTLKFAAAAGDLPKSLPPGDDFFFDIPVPIDGIVNDVDCRVRIENGLWWNTDVDVIAPSTTDSRQWDNGIGGCNPEPMFIRYDDEGATANACATVTTDINGTAFYFGFPNFELLDVFDGEGTQGTWQIHVNNVDNFGFGQTDNVTIAELFINMTADFTPGFPNQMPYAGCVPQPLGNNNYLVPAGCGVPQLDNCSDVTLTYLDTNVSDNCASGLTGHINRKWTAKDASGNTSTCIQRIDKLRPSLIDVVMPLDYDGIDAPFFDCTDNLPIVNGHPNPTPDWIEGQGLQGYPWVFGQPTGCSINWEWHDYPIIVCDGTVKYRREWTVIDWCIGDGFIYNQILKVVDDEGPSITCPSNLTVSTDPFSCCATFNLPDVIVEDNCSRINNISGMIVVRDPYTGDVINMLPIGGALQNFPGNNWWDLDTLANFGWTPCLPIGTHTVTYVAEDDCGNTSSCNFNIIVRDYVPPVAACDETTTIAIGIDDPFDCYGPAGPASSGPEALGACDFAGVTWVKATTFDDGSYDNCGGVKFTIRRMAPYSDCILALNSTNGHLPCDDPFPDFPNEFERAISEQDSIKFYCCEVGTIQTIILSVYQTDVNGTIQVGQDGTPIKNECMIQVEVQDKLKPVCLPPAQVAVNCENFDPSLWAYGKAQVADNCCLDTSRVYQGQCGLTHTASYTLFDTVCNKGTITRTFRAFDCHGFSSQCTQRVIVTYEQDYFIKFPNDEIVTVCDGSGLYGEPIFFGEDCELLGVSYEDEVYTVVPDACFKIERTWTIINWCTYNPNGGCINVPNPNPNPITNNAANRPGPTVSDFGTLPPWAPTSVRINPTDAQPTNFSAYWGDNTAAQNGTAVGAAIGNDNGRNEEANCYKYKQIIKVIDGQAPTATYVVPDCSNQNWFTPNDPLLWNQTYWWDNGLQTHDLCEEPTDLCITGTDACSGANINIEYLLFLDLDGDGIMETVVSSTSLGIAGLGWNTVWYNNLNTPNFAGGTPRSFDGRPVPQNQKWGFSIQETVAGNSKTACVRFNTQQTQGTHVLPQLPHGTHKIKWQITDGCGNNSEYEYTFTVKDCKAPTVVCLNGLSVNIMPTGMIQLWASDFLQYTEDNCTPSGQIKIGIRKCGTGTGFPVDGNGNPITNVIFDCNELSTQCVELWAIDAAGNADYCETYVIVQDNLGNCPNGTVNVAGVLKTEMTDGVEEATVNVDGSVNFLPPFSYFDLSDNAGAYEIKNHVPVASTFVIAPENDLNPLNGVTTYDLVLISKHILGIEPLTSPYKMIAADANKSGSITTFDIVEIRKLILGIYTELPNNTSWRFVDKSFVFPNANNPFQTTFPEVISIADALLHQVGEDFTSVKIGDVNNTAVANATMVAEERTAGTAIFDIEDRDVKAGEEFEVSFKSEQALKGFQFTATLNGLTAVDVVRGENVTENNFNMVPNAMAVSIDGAQGFTVRFRADKAGKLSEMLGVSGSITRAEAYGDAGRLNVAFRFSGKTIAGVGFELYQNQPNPFLNRTTIGFFLPEAAEATLSVIDETGRTVYQQKGQFAKGDNTIALDRALINTTGVLYYKLETSTDSATKKMIQAK